MCSFSNSASNHVSLTAGVCDHSKKSWIFGPYVFNVVINLHRDTADPDIHLFLVLGCHIVASLINLEDGRREGGYQDDNKNKQIQTS